MQTTPDQSPENSGQDKIKNYFSSIADAFIRTRKAEVSQKPKDDPALLTVGLFLLILSLIPVIPALINLVVGFAFRAQYFIVYRTNVPVHAFWFWYTVCALIFGFLFSAGLFERYRRHKALERKYPGNELLTRRQYNFALCYGVLERVS
jgi:hypothetical protein